MSAGISRGSQGMCGRKVMKAFDAQYAARTFLLMYPPTPIDDCETADALIAFFNEAVEARERAKELNNEL